MTPPPPISVRQIIRRTRFFSYKILKILFGTCLSSNSGLAIGCTDPLFLYFLQYFPSCRDNTSIGPRIFPSKSLPGHHVWVILPFWSIGIFPMSQQPVCQDLNIEASWSHSITPQSLGHLWTSDQLVAQTSTRQHTTLTRERHPCPR